MRIAPILIAALAVSACAGRPATKASADIEAVRAATRAYLVFDSAVAAGYPSKIPECLVHEHHGAMGYHHVNRKYMDAIVDVERPEILLYERMPDGRYQLNGVEFIVPYSAWPRDSVAPVVLGEHMKREDNLKFWFLHVWAWKENPDGPFADFHPAVQCPEGTGKIYRAPAGS